jgi:uncharacterized membrane protein YccC
MRPMTEAERHAEIAKACQAYRGQMAANQSNTAQAEREILALIDSFTAGLSLWPHVDPVPRLPHLAQTTRERDPAFAHRHPGRAYTNRLCP